MIPKAIPERAATGSSGEDGVGDAIILFYCATKVALLERLPSAHTPRDSPYPARVGRASPYPLPTSLIPLSPSPSTHALRILQFSAPSLSSSPPSHPTALRPLALQLSALTPYSSPPPHSPALRHHTLLLSASSLSSSPTPHSPALQPHTHSLLHLSPNLGIHATYISPLPNTRPPHARVPAFDTPTSIDAPT